MLTVSIHEAKTHLSALISRIEQTGEPIIVSRHGRAVAQITVPERGKRSVPDPLLSKINIKYDPTQPTEEEWDDA